MEKIEKALNELLREYDTLKIKWVEKYKSEIGFNEWFIAKSYKHNVVEKLCGEEHLKNERIRRGIE